MVRRFRTHARALFRHLIAFLPALLPSANTPAAQPPSLPWSTSPAYRTLPLQPVPAPTQPGPGFSRLTPADLGIAFTNRCSPARYAKRQNLMNGAGVALGDFDGDGWCDIYFCNREGPNALFRNLGNWRFQDVTRAAGVAATNLISSGALFADLNGDGHLDLHVTSFLGPDALFLNRGDGTFTNTTASAGISSPGAGTSSAAADLDGDGDLDLYVARFAVEALLRDGSTIATRMVNGQPVVTGRAGKRIKILNNKLYENGEPDLILLNDGQARFTPIAWKDRFTDESGQPLAEAPGDLGFTVQLRDIDGNGTTDVYVCNDFQTPDRVWLGDGRGRFRAMSNQALRNMSYASMGVDFADIDRNGFLDFYTVEMLPADHFRHLTHIVRGADPDLRQPRQALTRDPVSRSVLAWNRGDGTYADIAWYSHTATSDWSWTPLFLDVDLDGYEDLLISSGYPHDVNHLDFAGAGGRGEGRKVNETFTEELLRYPPLDSPHLALRNQGDLTFSDQSDAWHFNFRAITHGMALADLDNDGDLDVIGNSFNAPPLICRNDAIAPRIAVRLRGVAPNTDGTGARIRITGGGLPVQEQEMLTGGRYLSCDQAQRTFAVRPGTSPVSIEIRWHDGRVSRVDNVQPNHLYEVLQSQSTPAPPLAPLPPAPPSLFAVLSTPETLTHTDPTFDEFTRQPLLPWRQTFQGPGLAWVGNGPEAPEQLLLSNGRGKLPLAAPVSGDTTRLDRPSPLPGDPPLGDLLGLLSVSLRPGTRTLIATLAQDESGSTPLPAALTWNASPDGASWIPGPALPGGSSSPGPLAAADIDGDGDLDVVIGGRYLAGRYPEPAETRVYLNHDGQLSFSAQSSAPLATAGLASGLLLTDLDGDSRPELVIACEWGPVRVYRFEKGVPVEQTARLGLEGIRGIWQSLAASDFDGDGRLDLAVGNWGLNSQHQRSPAGPWQLAHADFDRDGRTTLLEGYFLAATLEMVPFRTRDMLAGEMPWLPATFPKHADFARASIRKLLGEHENETRFLEVNTLATVILLNRGDRFELWQLPKEVQWTPVQGLAAADFDGDGDIDLFCSQNFFDVREEEDRFDAGNGLLLVNDGKAGFTSASSLRSGILIPAQQRAAVVSDFDRDGRVDLAVGVNGGSPVILRNQGATPGLRVRVAGPPNNPDAIGTTLRLRTASFSGPIHEVRAGNGHLGQDSLTTILAAPGGSTGRRLEFRFPGLAPQTAEVPDTARSITLHADGSRVTSP